MAVSLVQRPAERTEAVYGIQAIPLGSVWQDGKEWPIRGAIVVVTQELATRFLASMGEVQRGVKAQHMASLHRDLERGKFLFTGEPILFSDKGHMIDGQHRCRVCVDTGKDLTCLVLFGIPESSFKGVNVTAKRTGADTLRIGGHVSATSLAAVAKWLFKYEREMLWTNVVVSPTEVAETVEGHPGLATSVVQARNCRDLNAGHAMPAFCHYLFSNIDSDTADEFFERLGSDVGHEDGDPVLALRRRLLSKGDPELTTRQQLGCFWKAWNLHRLRRACRSVNFRVDEELPVLR